MDRRQQLNSLGDTSSPQRFDTGEDDLRTRFGRGHQEPGGTGQYLPPPEDDRSDDGRWSYPELAAAVALVILASLTILLAGGFVEAIVIDSDNLLALTYLLFIATAFAASIVLAKAFRLSVQMAARLLAAGLVLNIAAYFLTYAGREDLLGVPSFFFESAIASSIPFGVAWLFISSKPGLSTRWLGFVSPQSPVAYLMAIGAWILAYIGLVLWTLFADAAGILDPPDNVTPLVDNVGGSLFLAWIIAGLWASATAAKRY